MHHTSNSIHIIRTKEGYSAIRGTAVWKGKTRMEAFNKALRYLQAKYGKLV